MVLLAPGNGGSVAFCRAGPEAAIGETAHPMFGARRIGADRVEMVARAVELPTGVIPVARTAEVVDAWNRVVGEKIHVPATSVLNAALDNPNPRFHL